jgi:hypothetical protein
MHPIVPADNQGGAFEVAVVLFDQDGDFQLEAEAVTVAWRDALVEGSIDVSRPAGLCHRGDSSLAAFAAISASSSRRSCQHDGSER